MQLNAADADQPTATSSTTLPSQRIGVEDRLHQPIGSTPGAVAQEPQPSPDRPSRQRARTASAKIANAREKHPLHSGCGPTCHRQCGIKFDEERRRDLHRAYWTMTYNERRIWASRLIKTTAVHRHRRSDAASNNDDKHERSISLQYHLPHQTGGEDVNVCQKFFVATLGYTSNRFIFEMTTSSGNLETRVVPAPDKRGTHRSATKIDRGIIEEHIMSFQPQISHYRREHAPNRLYLPNNLNATLMFQDFREKHPAVRCSAETYRKVLLSSNVSFSQPNSDICDECALYEHAVKTSEIETKSRQHKAMAQKARDAYRSDSDTEWSPDTAVYAVDMQKVLLLPRLHDLKSCIFTSRLVVFNETFARMGRGSKGNNILAVWNESVAGRKKEDVASAYHAVIDGQRDVDKFVFWVDNCSGQNKNWALYSMFLKLVNMRGGGPSEITLKYLVPGHTHMQADSVHGHIEKKLRSTKDVYDMQDLTEIMRSATKRNEVMSLEPKDFRDWPNILVTRSKRNKLPLLADVVQVRFERGDKRLFYKTDLDGDETAIGVLKKDAELTIVDDDLTPARRCARGIRAAKKETIVKELASRMPFNRRCFWETLPESETSEDLLKTFE